MKTTRISAALSLSLCASLLSAEVLPYKPSGEKDLMTLGAASSPRFSVPKELTWPAEVGQGEICLWKDDKFAAISITIDDNCKPDHQWWLKNAEKYGFHLTWFLITDWVKQDDPVAYHGQWSDFRKLLDAGHAVESHTTNHKWAKNLSEAELRESYAKSIETIEKNLPGHKVTCMAYPYGDASRSDIASEYFIAVRGVVGKPCLPASVNWMNTDMGNIYRDHVDSILTGKAEKTAWLNNPDFIRGWMPCLYHDVAVGKTPEAREAAVAKAQKQIDYMGSKTDLIWFGSFPEVAKYGQERDSATLSITPENSGYAISITDRMRDDIFSFPLTVKIRVPDSWKDLRATQNGKPAAARLISHNGARYALVDVIPDQEKTFLSAQ